MATAKLSQEVWGTISTKLNKMAKAQSIRDGKRKSANIVHAMQRRTSIATLCELALQQDLEGLDNGICDFVTDFIKDPARQNCDYTAAVMAVYTEVTFHRV